MGYIKTLSSITWTAKCTECGNSLVLVEATYREESLGLMGTMTAKPKDTLSICYKCGKIAFREDSQTKCFKCDSDLELQPHPRYVTDEDAENGEEPTMTYCPKCNKRALRFIKGREMDNFKPWD